MTGRPLYIASATVRPKPSAMLFDNDCGVSLKRAHDDRASSRSVMGMQARATGTSMVREVAPGLPALL